MRAGCNLILCKSIDHDVLRELARIAEQSGAKITLSTRMDYALIRELLSAHPKSLSFIDGLAAFEKEK